MKQRRRALIKKTRNQSLSSICLSLLCVSDNAQATIDELHNKGKWVSCYISVGTVESWREDAGAFQSSVVGNSWPDWEGEKFLDIAQQVLYRSRVLTYCTSK